MNQAVFLCIVAILVAPGCYVAGLWSPIYGCSAGCATKLPAGGVEVGLQYDYKRTVRASIGGRSIQYRLRTANDDLVIGPFLTAGLDVTVARWSWALLRASGRYEASGVSRAADPDVTLSQVRGAFFGLGLMVPIPDGVDGTRVDHQSVSLSTGATTLFTGGAETGDRVIGGALMRLEAEVGVQLIDCLFLDDRCPGYVLQDRSTPPVFRKQMPEAQ